MNILPTVNPNILPVLWRMEIVNVSRGRTFTVLFNPESYTLERATRYSESAGLDSNMPSIQFISGTVETLSFDLFFDTFSAGGEVGGDMARRAKFTGNSLLPSVGKQLDVRDYMYEIYDLMQIDPNTHAPALCRIKWSDLQFEGHLVECKQEVIKFNERGLAVRAKLHCTFKSYMKPSEVQAMRPKQSPDTDKYRTVNQGDSLWAHAAREYGQPDKWREIARANGIVNPRLLDSGSLLRFPAL